MNAIRHTLLCSFLFLAIFPLRLAAMEGRRRDESNDTGRHEVKTTEQASEEAREKAAHQEAQEHLTNPEEGTTTAVIGKRLDDLDQGDDFTRKAEGGEEKEPLPTETSGLSLEDFQHALEADAQTRYFIIPSRSRELVPITEEDYRSYQSQEERSDSERLSSTATEALIEVLNREYDDTIPTDVKKILGLNAARGEDYLAPLLSPDLLQRVFERLEYAEELFTDLEEARDRAQQEAGASLTGTLRAEHFNLAAEHYGRAIEDRNQENRYETAGHTEPAELYAQASKQSRLAGDYFARSGEKLLGLLPQQTISVEHLHKEEEFAEPVNRQDESIEATPLRGRVVMAWTPEVVTKRKDEYERLKVERDGSPKYSDKRRQLSDEVNKARGRLNYAKKQLKAIGGDLSSADIGFPASKLHDQFTEAIVSPDQSIEPEVISASAQESETTFHDAAQFAVRSAAAFREAAIHSFNIIRARERSNEEDRQLHTRLYNVEYARASLYALAAEFSEEWNPKEAAQLQEKALSLISPEKIQRETLLECVTKRLSKEKILRKRIIKKSSSPAPIQIIDVIKDGLIQSSLRTVTTHLLVRLGESCREEATEVMRRELLEGMSNIGDLHLNFRLEPLPWSAPLYRLYFENDSQLGYLDTMEKIAAVIGKNHLAEHVEPDVLLEICGKSSKSFKKQWSLQENSQFGIQPPKYLFKENHEKYIKPKLPTIVAVIDSGIKGTHPDLAPNMLREWKKENGVMRYDHEDPASEGPNTSRAIFGYDATQYSIGATKDYSSHGTHCAGIIGAAKIKGKGSVVGVAGMPGMVRLMSCKFHNDNGNEPGTSLTSRAIECINFAVKYGAKILNCSFSLPQFDKNNQEQEFQALTKAFEDASKNGAIIVSAAGNDGKNFDGTEEDYHTAIPRYPQINLLLVAATNQEGNIARDWNNGKGSNFGNRVHLAAPGEDILSTWVQSRENRSYYYVSCSGTSMAAPHVSGALAVMWAHFSDYTSGALVKKLLKSCDKIAHFRTVEYGRLNLAKACAEELPPSAAASAAVENRFSGGRGSSQEDQGTEMSSPKRQRTTSSTPDEKNETDDA